jgi:hypothetical protein
VEVGASKTSISGVGVSTAASGARTGVSEGERVAAGVGSICSLRMVFLPQAGSIEIQSKRPRRAKGVDVLRCRIAGILLRRFWNGVPAYFT